MQELRAHSPKVSKRRSRMRRALIEVATRKFAERGPDGVSIEEIIEGAEMARTTFYTFYPSKEDLLADIVLPVFEQGIQDLKRIRIGSPEAVARAIADVYLGLWQENRDALIVAKKLGMKYFALIEEVHRAWGEALRRPLDALEKSGRLRNGKAAYAAQLIARSAVQFLEIYGGDACCKELFRDTMEGLLVK